MANNAGETLIVRASGYGLRMPKKRIRGTDAAGQIEAVGKNVARFREGDEVLGWCEGAFAEYVCADESHFVPKPAGLPFEGAATLAMAGCTALQGLRDTGAVPPARRSYHRAEESWHVRLADRQELGASSPLSADEDGSRRLLGADHVIANAEDSRAANSVTTLSSIWRGPPRPRVQARAHPERTLALSSGGAGSRASTASCGARLVPFRAPGLRMLGTKETHEIL